MELFNTQYALVPDLSHFHQLLGFNWLSLYSDHHRHPIRTFSHFLFFTGKFRSLTPYCMYGVLCIERSTQ